MFLPHKSKIFDELCKQSAIVEEAAQVFDNIARAWKELKNASSALQTLERRGDELVHRITDDIEKTFVLPLRLVKNTDSHSLQKTATPPPLL